jgi:hypothetical protein
VGDAVGEQLLLPVEGLQMLTALLVVLLERLVEFAQSLFGRALRGDVAQLHDQIAGTTALVAHGGDVDVRPQHRAVAAQVALLGIERGDAALDQIGQRRLRHRDVVGMRDLGRRMSDQLGGVIAEHPLQRRVDLDPATLHVDDGHADPGGLHGQTESIVVVGSFVLIGEHSHCGRCVPRH